jgi:transposase
MAKGFRPVDRDQSFLLPPDMREWLPAGHLAWFVIDAVGALGLSRFEARVTPAGSWAGRAAYDPGMLLALLVYGYATGVRSSRRIERACGEDVAFRVICAQDVPDHATIARFRREHFAGPGVVEDLFAQVLVLAARAGLGKLGLIAVDGTKIAASASKGANRTEAGLRALARQVLEEAEAVDAAEDALFGQARGDELPAELADPKTRAERIGQALAELEAERQAAQAQREQQASACLERHQAGRGGRATREARVAAAQARLDRETARYQARTAARAAREQAARQAGRGGLPGKRPVPPGEYCRVKAAAAALARAQAAGPAGAPGAAAPGQDQGPVRNITDPGSRLMPVRGGGFIQGYNAQAVHSAGGLCLATMVTAQTTDYACFEPMAGKAQAAQDLLRAHARGPLHRKRARIGTLLADAGYLSAGNLACPGPDRLIATGKRRDLEQASSDHPAMPARGRGDMVAAMAARLATGQGRAAYRRRAPLAEGPFGDIKHNRGLRRFSLRGLHRVTGEWAFQNTVTNLLKIHHALQRPARA